MGPLIGCLDIPVLVIEIVPPVSMGFKLFELPVSGKGLGSRLAKGPQNKANGNYRKTTDQF